MRALFLPFAVFLSVGLVSPARAALTLCNRTSYIVYAATAQQSANNVLSHGWTRLIPGDCQAAIAGDLTAPAYFIYARTSPAHAGSSRAWGGSASICARDADFSLQVPQRAPCAKFGATAFPFAPIDTHRMHAWTMTLTESSAIFSLSAARLAGLKRLLRDNGLKTGPIDPGPDKVAAKSFIVFRSRRPQSATAKASDLFDVLESDALKRTCASSSVSPPALGGCPSAPSHH